VKILLAVDGSRHSRWAQEFVLRLPLVEEPEISVLSVAEHAALIHPVLYDPVVQRYRSQIEEEIRSRKAAAHKLAQQAADQLRARWKNVQALSLLGSAADVILDQSQGQKPDLLVLGSRGLSDIQTFFLGSVSQKITTYAPGSVLIVKRRVRTCRKILVAADGSEHTECVIRFLKQHFRPEGLQIYVLYVWQYAIRAPQLPKEATVEGRYSQALAQAGFSVQPLFLEGHAAQQIVEAAQQKGVHLVVVGARGLSGLKRYLLGSVSQKVIKYSAQSVLVVRG
jgi:nucleotide-binding universal stress UspA family protein